MFKLIGNTCFVYQAACSNGSRITMDGSMHRKQAKQQRKRAFVNSLKARQQSGFFFVEKVVSMQ
jgi:hypothetical protein